MGPFPNLRAGHHLPIAFDEGLGRMPIGRGEVLDTGETQSTELPRVRRLVTEAAAWNPDRHPPICSMPAADRVNPLPPVTVHVIPLTWDTQRKGVTPVPVP